MRRLAFIAAAVALALAVFLPAISTADTTSWVTNPMSAPLNAAGYDITNAHNITGDVPDQGLYFYSDPFPRQVLIQASTGPAPTHYSGAGVAVETGLTTGPGRVILQGEGLLFVQGNEHRTFFAGTSNPSKRPGLDAEVGSLDTVDDGHGHGTLWFKTGDRPTDWAKVAG